MGKKIKSKSDIIKKHMKKLKKKGFKVKHIKLATPRSWADVFDTAKLCETFPEFKGFVDCTNKVQTCADKDMHIDVLVHDLMTEIEVLDIPVTGSFITALVEDIEDALERRKVTNA